jgi:hypothetical protein
MTQEQFDNTGFTGGMFCVYKEKEFEIVQVDFEERLIGIQELENFEYDEHQVDWKRCENVEII